MDWTRICPSRPSVVGPLEPRRIGVGTADLGSSVGFRRNAAVVRASPGLIRTLVRNNRGHPRDSWNQWLPEQHREGVVPRRRRDHRVASVRGALVAGPWQYQRPSPRPAPLGFGRRVPSEPVAGGRGRGLYPEREHSARPGVVGATRRIVRRHFDSVLGTRFSLRRERLSTREKRKTIRRTGELRRAPRSSG